MKLNRLIIAALMGLLLAIPASAQDNAAANSTDPEIDALKKEIQALEQKVELLQQEQAMQKNAAQKSESAEVSEWNQTNVTFVARNVPRISLGADGFKFISADTNFSMNIRGYMQLDSRTFFDSGYSPGNDGFILRRVHPTISGTVFRDFDYQFMAEFGGSSPSIYDAYLNYHPLPELQLEAGRFKTPFGLEWLQSAANLSFNERSLATDLVPLRDLGVELHGDLLDGRVNYAAGIFNSVADGANAANSDFDNNMEFIGRVFLEPFKKSKITALQGIGFGLAGSYGSQFTASALTSGYKTDGQENFFAYTNGVTGNGAHWRISPQGFYYCGPLSLSGEYVLSDQQVAKGTASADLQNTAWEISGGWVLTGESASYNGVTPRHPFSLSEGGWGAWQLVMRYEELDVDAAAFPVFANPATSASAADAWSVGLNWWLNKNVRVMTSFSRTTFTDGNGTGATVTRQPENVLFTRLQLAF
jgi:phosphate-selective porin OprO and OprP